MVVAQYHSVSKNPSDIIKAKRAGLGLSQEQAAALAGCTVSTWRGVERGTVQNPTMDTCLGIARALRCELSDIWTWARKRTSQAGDAA
mgnify:CR=1 FL=1